MKLQNDKVTVTFNEEKKEIFGMDLTDPYNEPAFYNESVRGIKQAWASLAKAFNDQTVRDGITMYAVLRMLGENGIKTHSYCRVN